MITTLKFIIILKIHLKSQEELFGNDMKVETIEVEGIERNQWQCSSSSEIFTLFYFV